MSRRLDRLNEQLKREIAQKIRTELRDPRVGFVTVTAVRVSPDLAYAKVLVRIAGDEKQVQDGLDGLAASGPWLRRALGAELRIRRAPELDFQIDETLDNAMRIEAILDEVRPEDGWESRPDDKESEAELVSETEPESRDESASASEVGPGPDGDPASVSESDADATEASLSSDRDSDPA